MPTRNVVLTDHQSALVERLVAEGHYQNASEVLREGLRLIERRERRDAQRLRTFEAAIGEGEAALARGDFRQIDSEDVLARFIEDLQTE